MKTLLLIVIFIAQLRVGYASEADSSKLSEPPHLIAAYNKCEDGEVWSYSVLEKKKAAKQSKTKITSLNPRVVFKTDEKWTTVGEFKTEADCFEAKIMDKEKNGSDVSDNCRKRFAGKDVVVSVYEAKAMVKFSYSVYLASEVLTFSTFEKCNENILKKRKYRFSAIGGGYEDLEIGPYKSSESMRFIDQCKEVSKVVCKNDDAGYSKVDHWD